MNRQYLLRKLKSQDSIKTRLYKKIKINNSATKSKSSKKCLRNILKSETQLNKIYIKEMKILSNVIKSLTIKAEKEFEDCGKSKDSYKYNQIPSLYINGSNLLTKKNTVKNSATTDLITKIIEVNNESILKNSPRDNSKTSSLCQNDNSPYKFIKLLSFSKIDKKKHYLPSTFKHESNIEEKQSPSLKISTNKINSKISKKSVIESKNIDKNSSSTNSLVKNKKSDQLKRFETEKKKNNNNRERNSHQSNECKKHSKNNFLKLPIKLQKINKEGSSVSLSEHNEDKYFSSFSDQGKNLLKSTIVHFGLSTISDNKNFHQSIIGDLNLNYNGKINDIKSLMMKNELKLSRSNKQKELANSILGLDIDKLKKEIYEYENTEITDAINRLPTMKFDNNMKMISNNEKNKESLINNMKYIEREKTKKIKKLNKRMKLNKERERRLQRKKYVYDSLDDEEYEDIEENSFYFKPDSIFIYIIDFLIFSTSFIGLFYFPIHLAESFFYIGFKSKDVLFYFTDFIFIIDLIIGFFKAYYNFEEYLIIKSSLIIKNYFQNWFISDFICCIPFYTILKLFKKETLFNGCYDNCYFDFKGNNLYHLLALIKIAKILKVLSSNIFLKSISNQLMKNNFINDWGNVFKYLFLFISILNIGSSVFIFVARNSYPNWILDLDINKTNFVNIYICSIHHIITTMTTIGYGDIVPKSNTEKIFEVISLIVSTCLYSWIVSSASNYIKKMNEKYIKFEKNKEILDEININYPLMNEYLYERIYQFLSYGKSHEEVDKNIILESLPYSIRNELLIQMYDPIINNFKLFRYFENSEFIIRFVSLLKPMVCSKDDILVNEGDFMEDIIFNNSGILSIDVCIDLNKPKESIEEYLTKYNLGKKKNNVSFNQDQKRSNKSLSSSKYSFVTAKLSQLSSNNVFSTIGMNDNHFIYKKSKNEKNLKFIKILYIRRKEYFGTVLMFLNEKSPIYIRVHSKKAEIFLLRKTDVVNLSSDYPKIWDKMNGKSLFNFEQIKNIISRKLTSFCNYNGIRTKLLFIKKDPINCLYSCPNYLMSIPDSMEDGNNLSLSQCQSSDISKSKNIDNTTSEFQEHFENDNNNKIYAIKEESNKENNINSNLKINQNSFKNIKQSIIKNNKNDNSKFISNISKQNLKIEYPPITKNKNNNSIDISDNTNSNITNISNNNYLSPYWNKKIIYPLSSSIMDNSFNEDAFPLNRKNKKKTKSSDYCAKKRFNKGHCVKHSFASNNNIDYGNITSPRFESGRVNDEIYSNENFDIILKEEDDELMSKNIKNMIKTLSTKILEYNNQKKQEKVNNKFNNLKISSSYNVEIKSSYDNLNVFTNYRYIIDNDLRKKTKHLLAVECGFISQFSLSNKKFDKSSIVIKKDSKPIKKILKMIKSKNSDSSRISRNNYRRLSYYKSDDVNLSIRPNENLLSKRSKNCESIRKAESFYVEKKLNNSVIPFKQTSSVKSKNYLRKSYKKRTISNSSDGGPKKKNRKKNDVSSDIFVKKKARRKIDLISENMQRDRQNLNNPSEFYADLFSSFVVNNPQINGSGISNLPLIKINRNEES